MLQLNVPYLAEPHVAGDHRAKHLFLKELADVARDLLAEGVVERTVIPDTPVRVEYELTRKGRALAGAFFWSLCLQALVVVNAWVLARALHVTPRTRTRTKSLSSP